MASATAEQRAMNIQSPPWTKEEDEMFDIYPDKLPAAAERTIAELTGRSQRAVNQRYHILKRRKRDEEAGEPVRRNYNKTKAEKDPAIEYKHEPVVMNIPSEQPPIAPSASLVQALAPAHKQPKQEPQRLIVSKHNRKDGWTEEEDAILLKHLRKLPEEVLEEMMATTGRSRSSVTGRWSKLRNAVLAQDPMTASAPARATSLDDIVAHTGDIQELQVTRLEKELLEKIATVVYQVNGKLFTLKVVG